MALHPPGEATGGWRNLGAVRAPLSCAPTSCAALLPALLVVGLLSLGEREAFLGGGCLENHEFSKENAL